MNLCLIFVIYVLSVVSARTLYIDSELEILSARERHVCEMKRRSGEGCDIRKLEEEKRRLLESSVEPMVPNVTTESLERTVGEATGLMTLSAREIQACEMKRRSGEGCDMMQLEQDKRAKESTDQRRQLSCSYFYCDGILFDYQS